MTAGFQLKNEGRDDYQIDGMYRSMVLARHIQVVTNTDRGGDEGIHQGPDLVNASYVLVPVAAGEVVAWRCDAYCVVTSVSGGTALIMSGGPVGTTIDLYFFLPITTSNATAGAQIFRDDGTLVFCASKKPLVFAGVTTGDGVFSYAPGRSYAAICITAYMKMMVTVFGAQPAVSALYAEVMGMVKAIGGGVQVDKRMTFSYFAADAGQAVYFPVRGETPHGNVFAVIDVTGY